MNLLLIGMVLLWTLLAGWALVYTIVEWNQSRHYLEFVKAPTRKRYSHYPKRDRDVAASLAVSLAVAVCTGALITVREILALFAGELDGSPSSLVTRSLLIVLAAGIANAVRVQKRERNRRV